MFVGRATRLVEWEQYLNKTQVPNKTKGATVKINPKKRSTPKKKWAIMKTLPQQQKQHQQFSTTTSTMTTQIKMSKKMHSFSPTQNEATTKNTLIRIWYAEFNC